MVLRCGIAGLGTVGAAVVRLLHQPRAHAPLFDRGAFAITGLSARTKNRDRGFDVAAFPWFDDPVALARSETVDIFVELIGGAEGVARTAVTEALKAGKHVVTANKALLAMHGLELARLADEHRVVLAYEAAVAGGIPVIGALRDGLAGNAVTRVYGILNGTCNYILTQMEEKRHSFETCLAEAQKLGYAEADPTFDVEGYDTAYKLALLTSLAFGVEVNASATSTNGMHIEGITAVTLDDIRAANRLGFRIKLLGMSMRTDHGIEQRVHPTMLRKTHALSGIGGVTNAVVIDGDAVGSVLLAGAGAGGDATASSVLSDLVGLARGIRPATFGRPAAALAPHVCAPMQAHEGGYYIRLNVVDKPGAIKDISGHFADAGISFKSILQDDEGADSGRESVEVVLITHKTTESTVRKVTEQLKLDGFVLSPTSVLRIEG